LATHRRRRVHESEFQLKISTSPDQQRTLAPELLQRLDGHHVKLPSRILEQPAYRLELFGRQPSRRDAREPASPVFIRFEEPKTICAQTALDDEERGEWA